MTKFASETPETDCNSATPDGENVVQLTLRTEQVIQKIEAWEERGTRGIQVRCLSGYVEVFVCGDPSWDLVEQLCAAWHEDPDAHHEAASKMSAKFTGQTVSFDRRGLTWELRTPPDTLSVIPPVATPEVPWRALVPAENVRAELIAELGQREDLRLTDRLNGEVLAKLTSYSVRWLDGTGWIGFDGRRWAPKPDAMTYEAGRLGLFWAEVAEAELLDRDTANKVDDWSEHSESWRACEAAVRFAKSEPSVHVSAFDYDQDGWLFNVENGTIDLRTGRLQPHSAGNRLTKLTTVRFDPAAQCPAWLGVIDKCTQGDADLADFLQRALGYSLTGDKTHHTVFVWYGLGANGKSTALKTIAKVLGEYASILHANLLTQKTYQEHTTDLADLVAVRFAYQPELMPSVLDETRLKQVSGGDKIKARKMRQDFFEFVSQCKLWLAFNSPPEIRGTDKGIWRRFAVLPFDADFSRNPDFQIDAKLDAELSGILNWLLEGLSKFRDRGLGAPEIVQRATSEFKRTRNHIFDFVSDCFEPDHEGFVSNADLAELYAAWVKTEVEEPLTQPRLRSALRGLGWRESRTNTTRGFKGQRVRRKP